MLWGDLIIVFIFMSLPYIDRWQESKAICPSYCEVDHICNKEINEPNRDN